MTEHDWKRSTSESVECINCDLVIHNEAKDAVARCIESKCEIVMSPVLQLTLPKKTMTIEIDVSDIVIGPVFEWGGIRYTLKKKLRFPILARVVGGVPTFEAVFKIADKTFIETHSTRKALEVNIISKFAFLYNSVAGTNREWTNPEAKKLKKELRKLMNHAEWI